MQELEQTLDSKEVAEMVDKEHSKLLKDIRRYIGQFTEAKIGFSEFFKESEYNDSTGRTLPCYRITKKGCEFIAHKLTGTKGTIFTARYINRFHEMQDIVSKQKAEPELPWFIRKFRGKYIMLFRDFETLTGISLNFDKAFWKSYGSILFSGYPLYYNGWGWHTSINKEEFKNEYGFDYGDDKCMGYFYPRGIIKALELAQNDKKFKLNQETYNMIMDGVKNIPKPVKNKAKEIVVSPDAISNRQPVQITVVLKGELTNSM